MNTPKEAKCFKSRSEYITMLNEKKRFILDAHDDSTHDTIRQLCLEPFDVVIAGGGPAGIWAAVHLSRQKIKTIILEKTLFLDSTKTFGLTDNMVEQYKLWDCVSKRNEHAYFNSYLGLQEPTEIGYCVIEPTVMLYLLAKQIDPAYCTVIQNCEVTAFQRLGSGKNSKLKIKTVVNDYRLVPYTDAVKQWPRATALSEVNSFFYQKYNTDVLLNTMDELDNVCKQYDNFKFTCSILLEASGFKSNIGKSFHRQKECNVWKCIAYEFDDMPTSQEDVIWDLAIPTETSSNFWVDVFNEKKTSAGVMVLTKTHELAPQALPEKSTIEASMSTWLNIRKLAGILKRERYGFIPMTDFKEPAAYDNIIFIGASSTRQVPNTGYGIIPALQEAEISSVVVSKALTKGDFSRKILHEHDIAWLNKYEHRMCLHKLMQNFHYAYKTDEYFNAFACKCSGLPSEIVKRSIGNELTTKDLLTISMMLLRNSYLLEKRRFSKSYYPEILDDFGAVLYCIISSVLRCYCPLGNRMFRNEPLMYPWPKSWFIALYVLCIRRIPELILRNVARLFFNSFLQKCMRIFAPKK